MINLQEIILLIVLFAFLFSIFLIILNLYFKDKIDKSINYILSLSISALLIYLIKFTVIGSYILEIFIPFLILSIFLLAMIYIFMQALGIKFGSGGEESGFINITSTIVMWVGLLILVISFLAALKNMGYSFINKMLDPAIFGVLFFFLIIYFMLNSLEGEENGNK